MQYTTTTTVTPIRPPATDLLEDERYRMMTSDIEEIEEAARGLAIDYRCGITIVELRFSGNFVLMADQDWGTCEDDTVLAEVIAQVTP